MTSTIDPNKAAFEARLQRIGGAARPEPQAVPENAMAGSRQTAQAPRKPGKQVSPLPPLRETIRYPASLLAAFGLGMVAVFITRWARFHLFGGSPGGDDGDITMIIDGVLAGALGFALRSALRFETPDFVKAHTAGIVVMILGMHNFVHWAPGAFDIAFSPEWTAYRIEMTEPNSILFRGVSIVLGPPESAPASPEKVMPSFIELDNG